MENQAALLHPVEELQGNQVIPEAAVEAAASSLDPSWAEQASPEVWRAIMKDALEAAAPHMLAECFDLGRSVEHYCERGWSEAEALKMPIDASDNNPYRPTQ